MNPILPVLPAFTFAASSLGNSQSALNEAPVQERSSYLLMPSSVIVTILVVSLATIYSLSRYFRSKTQPAQLEFIIPRNPDGTAWTPEVQLAWIKSQIKNPTLCNNPIGYLTKPLCYSRVKEISESPQPAADKVKQIVQLIKSGSVRVYTQNIAWMSEERCFTINTEKGDFYKFSDSFAVSRVATISLSR